MTLESVQNIDVARQILVEIVADHHNKYPYRQGILVAVLGGELSARGLRGIHHKFGSDKLADFVRDRCQPPLQIFRAPSGADFLVALAGDVSRPGLTADVSRLQTRPAATLGSWASVEPRVWKAVLSRQAASTFVGPSGEVTTGEMPSQEGWKQVQPMSKAEQGLVLEGVRAKLVELITNVEVRNAVTSALEAAKTAESPIFEFSTTMTGLYRGCQQWNRHRIDSVLSYVQNSTGIDLRTPREPRPSAQQLPAQPTPPPGAEQPLQGSGLATPTDEAAQLRQLLKDAIDLMSFHDLFELRVPAGAMHLAQMRRMGK